MEEIAGFIFANLIQINILRDFFCERKVISEKN